jgi:hypothetical protein
VLIEAALEVTGNGGAAGAIGIAEKEAQEVLMRHAPFDEPPWAER